MEDSLDASINALKQFWNRRSFHDMGVESIDRCNGRVIVILDDHILILTGTKKYRQRIEEFPTAWISDKVDISPRLAKLNVRLELGEFECEFTNLRLIRRSDYAILIPPLDTTR